MIKHADEQKTVGRIDKTLNAAIVRQWRGMATNGCWVTLRSHAGVKQDAGNTELTQIERAKQPWSAGQAQRSEHAREGSDFKGKERSATEQVDRIR